MVGKIILCVLAGILLALILLLQIPVRVRASYGQGDLALWVRFGPVKLQLFPRPEKAEKPEKKPKKEDEGPEKKPQKEKKKKAKKEKPKKPKARINREQIFYALEKLPPILGRALRRTGKSIRIEPLKVWLLVAGSDPADTAVLYGRLEAALAAGLPVLRRVVRIRDEDIRLYLDFTEQQMDCIADVGIALKPWSLVTMGVRALGSLIKWYLGFRKLASPPPPAEPETKEDKNTDTSEAA